MSIWLQPYRTSSYQPQSKSTALTEEPSFSRQPHRTTCPPSSADICLCVRHHVSQMCWQCKTSIWRWMTLDPQGFSHMSRCCLPFTLNLKPKPSCSPGATVGLLCLSATLYLFMQPSSAFDLSETTTRSCPDRDCEFCTLGGNFSVIQTSPSGR